VIVLTAVGLNTVFVRNQEADKDVLMTAGCFFARMYSAKDVAVSVAYPAASFLAGADAAAMGDVTFH